MALSLTELQAKNESGDEVEVRTDQDWELLLRIQHGRCMHVAGNRKLR